MAHERPSHGKHLLLTAGEGSRYLTAPFLKAGEQLENVGEIGRDSGGRLCESPHLEIFLDGHLQEDPPALRHMGKAALHQLVGRDAADVFPQKGDRAGAAA